MAIYSFNHDSFGKTTNRAGAAGDNAAYNARENETRLDNARLDGTAGGNAAYNAREEATYAVRSHIIPPEPREAEAWFRKQEQGERKNARMSDRFGKSRRHREPGCTGAEETGACIIPEGGGARRRSLNALTASIRQRSAAWSDPSIGVSREWRASLSASATLAPQRGFCVDAMVDGAEAVSAAIAVMGKRQNRKRKKRRIRTILESGLFEVNLYNYLK
jgi:hypothetical protein